MKTIILSILCLTVLIPLIAHGQDDIYRVKTPNVMIIFDTSNSMEQRPDGLSQGSGAVRVDSEGRVVSLPFGTVYDFEGKGNHPNSKLYQAKLALKEILQTVVKDRVNLGFSTYAQLKSPDHMWGYYWRRYRDYIAGSDATWYWQKLYWGYYPNRHGWSTTVFTKDSFKDEWGTTHVGVSVGYNFTRVHTMHNSWNNNKRNVPPPHPPGTFLGDLKYTVTSIAYNAEYNWYTYTYYSDYHDQYWEGYRKITMSNDLPIDCDVKFSKTWAQSGWTAYTYDSKDNEQKNNPGKWQCQGPFVNTPKKDPYITDWSSQQWSWDDRGEVASCEDTVGSDDPDPTPLKTRQWTKYTLDPGTCRKWSEYTYPANGTNDKPHTWSYFKIKDGKWPKSSQTPNYYFSKDGLGKPNSTPNTFDDHSFFVNFPDDKEAGFKDSNRTDAKNLILSFLDVTPVKSPGAPGWAANKYWTKLPMHDLFGKKGLTSYTQASGFTPLADSLLYANLYFSDYIFNYNGGDISSQNTMDGIPCRGNYIILLTDGLESARLKAGLPDYSAAADEAKALLDINVKTFVIGFGQDIVGNQTLNNIATAGGTDKAYFAADIAQLKKALQVIFQMISNQFYGRSNPVITRTRDRLFRGAFEIKDGDYYGHMMAWDADRMTGALAPDFAWDSGEVMASAGRGTVYTWVEDKVNPSRVLFDPEDSSLYPLVNPSGEDINNSGATDSLDAKAVIKYTLDSKYNDCTDFVTDKVTGVCHGPGYYKGKRPLDWVLGDIYHSTPVVVGEPAFFFSENGYQDFYNANKGRETMIYVGTNDGMLHGFRNSGGAEKFAVIPRSLLGKLKNLNAAHDFYVDASPKAYDVYFAGESKWKTVIISGLRGGGPYYVALDVTNPADPKILWEWTHPNMGQAWAKPDIGRVKVGAATKFVAFIPGGYSTTDDRGNSFYILDIETGTPLKTWAKSNAMPVGDSTNKIPSGPTAFDSDMDGIVNYVYFGDIQGTLWKVDVSSTSVADWTLYDFWKDEAPKRRPIFYAPAVAKNDEGITLVYFGTGDEFNLTSDQVNYFYEVKDQGATGQQVWTRNLDPGEKVLSSPSIANWVVYFTTWTYTGHGERCGAGEGRLYGLLISKVGAPGASEGLVTMDSSTGKWSEPQSSITLGAGIPSAPLVTNGMIYIATSLNANRVIQIPIPGWAVARTRSWREVF